MKTARGRLVAAFASAAIATSGFALVTSGGVGAATAQTFGTLASPCSNASTTHYTATDKGVTKTGIAIATGDDAQYHGVNAELGNTVKAFASWCNAQGGINGRKITVDYASASSSTALQSAQAAIDGFCSNNDFMLVGEGFALDGGQAEHNRLACKLVAVPGFTATNDTQDAYESYQGIPDPIAVASGTAATLGTKIWGASATGNACAVRTTDLPSAQQGIQKDEIAYTTNGWLFDNCDINLTTTSTNATIGGAIYGAKTKGDPLLIWANGWGGELMTILGSGVALHYNPIIFGESNVYVESNLYGGLLPSPANFEHINGMSTAADNLYAKLFTEPFEAASTVPAVAKFISIAGADNKSALAEQSASSFLLWATAAKSCGAALTRQCVVNYLGKTSNFTGKNAWTAGGLQAPTNPATNSPSGCALIMHFSGGSWTQAAPSGKVGTFSCPTGKATGLVSTAAMISRLGLTASYDSNGKFIGDLGSIAKSSLIVPKK